MKLVNLESQTVLSDGKPLILNGKAVNGYKIENTNVTFEMLEELYFIYKHSIPDDIHYENMYFKALKYKDLSPTDLIISANRQSAKYNLELTLLTGVLNGSLIWPDDKKWFWQSKTDPDFVILKKWIKPDIIKLRKDDESA